MAEWDGKQIGTPYFSDWQTRIWEHSCGWTGTGDDTDSEYFDALFEVRCPKCGGKLTTITYPYKSSIIEAAEQGNAEAIKMLPQVAAQDDTEAKLAYCRAGITELPDLNGSHLTFTFAANESSDWMNPAFLLLFHEGKELYREPSGYEWWTSIPEVCTLILKRYGTENVNWMDPAELGEALLGDDFSARNTIRKFLTENSIMPPTGQWSADGLQGLSGPRGH